MHARTRIILLILLIATCVVLAGMRLYGTAISGVIERYARNEPESILFTGDIMLARDVEDRMRALGETVFFDLVRPLHERARYVVGNFEAAVPDRYVPTPDLTFQFSVDHALLRPLREVHVTHLSIANNHADDYGVAARYETVRSLREAGFVPFGQPRGVASSSVTYLAIDDARIAVLGFEDVLAPLDIDAARTLIRESSRESRAQIVYIHWGNEYESVHSERQEALARAFIDAGADLIIGHHPHVVQDIASIDHVPVIYSLGNYVFDQYWDDEVERGLAALVTIEGDSLFVELVPVRTDRARPRLQDESESRAFLEDIARRSDESVRSAVVRGSLVGRLH